MKKVIFWIFIIIILLSMLVGLVYAIDCTRMILGKPVFFSTWGNEYPITPIVNSDGNNEEPAVIEPATCEVTLYFADSNIMNLAKETRIMNVTDNFEKDVVQAVIDGPQDSSLYGLVPQGTKVISADVLKDSYTCVINLSKEFSDFTGGSSMENMVIYSIVNSLCSVDGIDNVKINIEGNESAFFGSHYSLEDPFSADMSLVK